jgi:hypothetical protein
MEVSGQLHTPAALSPEKEPLLPTGSFEVKNIYHKTLWMAIHNKYKCTPQL